MSEQTAPAIEIRAYDRLPEEATRIRREVFMEEQGFVDEFDDVDGRALHVVAFLDARPRRRAVSLPGNARASSSWAGLPCEGAFAGTTWAQGRLPQRRTRRAGPAPAPSRSTPRPTSRDSTSAAAMR